MTDLEQPIAIFYEHPEWFAPLFEALENRGVSHRRVDARQHSFDPSGPVPEWSLVYNRMSPSAWLRGLPGVVEHTRAWLAHLERRGVRVVNGARAFDVEVSKARQASLFEELGLAYPACRVIHRPGQAPGAAEELRFPVVVKPNLGGSGAGIRRFETPEALERAAGEEDLELGPDGTGLVQEYAPPRGGRIVRVEVVGGRFLYAIRVPAGEGQYDLCPADLETAPGPEANARSGPGADGPSGGESPDGACVEAHRPPARERFAAARILEAAGMEVGGVEYLVDDRDGTVRFYDVNANSNFVANAEEVVGFDPFARLVDFLVREARAEEGRAPGAGVPRATPAPAAESGASDAGPRRSGRAPEAQRGDA